MMDVLEMGMKLTFVKCVKRENGATAVIVALSMAMLIGFTSLAVDVGYMYATRNELQNVADAAALAGATRLGAIYVSLGVDNQQGDMTSYFSDIKGVASAVAKKNEAANVDIDINPEEIRIGEWDWDNSSLIDPAINPPDAVQVVARRSQGWNGPVTTFFARIFSFFGGSHDTFEASAVATAALSGPGIMDEGELFTPLGVSKNEFTMTAQDCGDLIDFKDTKDSCAGWHNFFDKPGEGSKMDEKFINLIAAHPEGPMWLLTNFSTWAQKNGYITEDDFKARAEVIGETSTGDDFYFTGGTVASLLPQTNSNDYLVWADGYDETPNGHTAEDKEPAPFPALFDFYRFRDDDGDNSVWTSTVPVYNDGDVCDNPAGFTEIVGFARIQIKDVHPPPNANITVLIDCTQVVVEGLSGGGRYGNIKGSIPNLVQ